jgi:branched-chain amino acid transport system substrate-binding protein
MIAVLLAVAVVFGACNRGPTVVTIGVALPLSGSMAEYGQNAREGITLASEELAHDPAIRKFELVYQDTREAPQETVDAVRRLIDVNGTRYIIGGLTSSGVLAAAPYAQSHGVLFFTPAASAPGIPQIGNLIFRNWPSDDAIAGQFGRAAYDRLGIRTVAILHVSNDYGKINAESFAASFQKAGGSVPLIRAFPQGTTDFKTLLAQAAAIRGLDKIFIIAYPDEYRSVFQQLAVSKLRSTSVLASDTFFSPRLLSQLASGTQGVICAVAAKPAADYQPRQKFIAAYRERFKGPDGRPKDPGLVSDTAYDALHLVALAISKTDGSPSAAAAWLLQNTKNYPGAAGPTTFSGIGDVKGELALYQVKGDQFVPLEH